jgi:hypothetical protein
LKGNVGIEFLVTRNNEIVNKRIKNLSAGFDNLHMINYNHWSKNSPKADSIYEGFYPWLSKYMNAIKIENAENDKYLKDHDSIWFDFAFRFNEQVTTVDTSIQTSVDPQFSFKLTSPVVEFPTSEIKGKIKGQCLIAVGVNNKSEIVHTSFMSIDVYDKNDTVHCELLKENSDKGIHYYIIFSPIIETYLKQIRVKNLKKLGENWQQYIGYEFKTISFRTIIKDKLNYIIFE